MRARVLVFFAALLMLTAPARAAVPDSIEAEAAENYFSIEPGYNGSSIVLFGSIDLDKLRAKDLDIAVIVQGPSRPVTVWKKNRHAGLWINSESATFESVPNYYAVLSTRPPAEMAPLAERKAYGIGLDTLAFPLKAGGKPEDAAPQEFQDALIRLKRSTGLFAEESKGAVELLGTRLFRSHVYLPAAAGAGQYQVRFYILQNGKVVGETNASIRLKKIGVEQELSTAALNYPWFYGIFAVLLAAAVGGGASFVFRRA